VPGLDRDSKLVNVRAGNRSPCLQDQLLNQAERYYSCDDSAHIDSSQRAGDGTEENGSEHADEFCQSGFV
jgi:hypothetical protein